MFVIALGVAAVALGEYGRALQNERDEARERSAERMLAALRAELASCDLLLRSIQAVFLARADISPNEFQLVHQALNPRARFGAMQAMVFSRKSAPGEPLAYLTEMVAPADGNERVYGLDVVSQPGNLRAIELSRDLDRPVVSASFQLIQREGVDEPADGVVIRAPAFSPGPQPLTLEERRAREIGSVGISFRVSELIHAGLGDLLDRGIQVQVVDVTDDNGQATVLYDSLDHGRTERAAADTAIIGGALEFGGRQWELRLLPTRFADAATVTLSLGWLISTLLAAALGMLTWSLIGRREHAVALAQTLSRRYRESEARFRALNELLPVAVVLSHADGRLQYVNETGRRLLALGDAETTRHRLGDFADPGPQTANDDEPPPLAEARALRALDGRTFWATLAERELQLSGEPLRLSVISDVSELHELTAQLSYQARHDSLTGLINRREFEHRLQQLLQPDATRRGAGLLYLDLDQFKVINDVSGHLAGDALLAQLGDVLRDALGPDDMIARLGGDEFGVLVANGDAHEVLAAAERLRQIIDEFGFSWEGKPYAVTASIGAIALDAGHPRCQRELLSLADAACYMAKENGRNRVHLFTENDLATSHRLREMEWIARLRSALAEDRLCLYYQELQWLQPGVTADGAHFELLIRLRDEHGELVPPGAFVPAAERFGLMPVLDRWVVSTALANFPRLHPAGDNIALCAINLSATTMEDEGFPAFVLDQLKRSKVPAGRICFEVTETAAIANMTRVIALIKQLRALGCRFAIDDFGAGMSSFGYLKDLPVDFIKIDGCFIREIETDPMSRSIVRAVTDIGHQMGAGVIAEFVNSEATCEILRGIGVDFVQGYLIHEPQPTASADEAEV